MTDFELIFATYLHPITSGLGNYMYLIRISVQSTRQHMNTGTLVHGEGRSLR